MLRDLATWLLYSPRRLLIAAVPLVALVAVAVTAQSAPDPESTATSPARSDPSPTPSVRSSGAEEEDSERTVSPRVIRQVAIRFLSEYVVPIGAATPDSMPLTLRRLSTPALWRGLRLTAPDSLPTGSVGRTSVESTGPFSGTAIAKIDSGQALVVSVVAWEKGWRVSDVRLTEKP